MSDATTAPDLGEVLRLWAQDLQQKVWTALPGVVQKYDATTQQADVKPSVVGFFQCIDGEEPHELPVIAGVPVVHPSGGGFFASFPLQAGDPVLLVFAAREIDTWKTSGPGVVRAADNRMHHLTDAFAMPGGRPPTAPLKEASAEDLVIGKEGGATVRVKVDGTVAIKPGGSALIEMAGATAAITRDDLLGTVKTMLETWAAGVKDKFDNHTHVTPSGTSDKVPAPGQQIVALPPLPGTGCSKVKGE